MALNESNGFYLSANGNKVNKKTTQCWKLLVEWKDGFSEWVSLKALKESNPIEVAEYAQANLIDKSPAFRWYVPHVLRKQDRIVSKIKSKYWRTTHKFGIRLPKTVAEALQIDKEMGTDFWRKAIEKELREVKIAREVRDALDLNEVHKGKQLVRFTEIACHMVFDVKMDFTRWARFVAGSHSTDVPTTITYSSVVSRDSVRIAFTIAELNGFDVMCCDVGNAYLNAPCGGKVWFLGGGGGGGLDVGEDRGKILVLTRALYGLKSSGGSWCATLATTLENTGFESTIADPDVWRRKAQKPCGFEYYELMLVYVEDLMFVSHDPKLMLVNIDKIYQLKEGRLGKPDTYQGGQIYEHHLNDGRKF